MVIDSTNFPINYLPLLKIWAEEGSEYVLNRHNLKVYLIDNNRDVDEAAAEEGIAGIIVVGKIIELALIRSRSKTKSLRDSTIPFWGWRKARKRISGMH